MNSRLILCVRNDEESKKAETLLKKAGVRVSLHHLPSFAPPKRGRPSHILKTPFLLANKRKWTGVDEIRSYIHQKSAPT